MKTTLKYLLKAGLSIQIATQDRHITYYQVIGSLLVMRAKQKQRAVWFLGKEFLKLGKRKNDKSRVSPCEHLKHSVYNLLLRTAFIRKAPAFLYPHLAAVKHKNLLPLLPATAAVKRLMWTLCPACSSSLLGSQKRHLPVWVNCIHKSHFSTELCFQVPEKYWPKTDQQQISRGLPLKLVHTALHYLILTSVNIFNSCMVFH